MHQPDMTTVPPTSSKVDSRRGKSTDNFVGSPGQIQHISKHWKCKEQVTKHFNSVFDMSSIGNLPGKVCLELKENDTPYQAPVHCVPQALHKPLMSELDNLVDHGLPHKLRPDD